MNPIQQNNKACIQLLSVRMKSECIDKYFCAIIFLMVFSSAASCADKPIDSTVPKIIDELTFNIQSDQSALSDDSSGNILYFCNSRKSEIFISIDDHSVVPSNSGFLKKTINWLNLLQFGPETNGRGELLKAGSKVEAQQCGMFQIRIESGFINDNPEGESGALDFPIIELRIGERTVLQRTALEVCSVNDRRAKFYFGACPNYWAQSIATKMFSNGTVGVEIKRKFHDRRGQKKQITDKKLIFE